MKNNILYIVSTPLGNLSDFSFRAIEVLKQVDLIVAEDTRHSLRLLQHYHIEHKPLFSLHLHNETAATKKALSFLQEGKSLALMTDAGTPGVSDPGQHLVALAHQAGIRVVPIPGPCAAIVAWSVSGFSCLEFIFIGFLPSKSMHCRKKLETLGDEKRALLFYEAPHRLLSTLEEMHSVFGPDRRICFARELTKQYETIRVDTLSAIWQWVKEDPMQQQGECVLLVEGATFEKKEMTTADEMILKLLLKELPLKKAAQMASQITGISKNVFYDVGLSYKKYSL